MGIVAAHTLIIAVAILVLGQIHKQWCSLTDFSVSQIRISIWCCISALVISSAITATGLSVKSSLMSRYINIPRSLEYFIIMLSLALLVVYLGWRIVLMISQEMRIRKIKQGVWYSLKENDLEDIEQMEEVRLLLQKNLRIDTGIERLKLKWSDEIQLPFTIGFLRPTIFLPVWTAYQDGGKHIKMLLEHEKEHVKMKHYVWNAISLRLQVLFPIIKPLMMAQRLGFEVQSDRIVYNNLTNADQIKYFEAIDKIVMPAQGAGLEIGLGHDRSDVCLRKAQASSSSRLLWQYLFSSILTISITSALQAVAGPIEPDRLIKLAYKTPSANYYTVGAANLKLEAIPGAGGYFEDGLRVDASRVDINQIVTLHIIRTNPFPDYYDNGFAGRLHVRAVNHCSTRLPAMLSYSWKKICRNDSDFEGVFIDCDRKEILESSYYFTQISEIPPPDRIVSNHWENGLKEGYKGWTFQIPGGWIIDLTNVTLTSYRGLAREENEVSTQMHNAISTCGPYAWNVTGNLNWSVRDLYETAKF